MKILNLGNKEQLRENNLYGLQTTGGHPAGN
jgi:hypothetical protein